MLRSMLAGMLAAAAIAGLGSTSATAGGYGYCDDCGYPEYGYYAYVVPAPPPPAYGYYYEPRVAYRGYDPRWQYAAGYYPPPPAYYAPPPPRVYYAPPPRAYRYAPPAPAYGYAYVSRGSGYLAPYDPWRRRRW